MTTHVPTEKSKKARGPRRLEYTPEGLRGISGVEHLTTLRQLKRLREYCHEEGALRPAFVRLGASTYSKRLIKKGHRSSATYAVNVEGTVSVVRRVGDPRRVHAWMNNARRAWNMACEEQVRSMARWAEAIVVRIVTLASLDASVAPDWMGDDLPDTLRPDGENIRRVWACAPKSDGGGFDREFVVEGASGWWNGRHVVDIAGIREAKCMVVCAEDATLWLGPLRVVEIPHYSFADLQLMEHRGEVCDHIGDFIIGQMTATIKLYAKTRATMVGAVYTQEQLEQGIDRMLSGVDPFTVRHPEVIAAAEALACAIIGQQGVNA